MHTSPSPTLKDLQRHVIKTIIGAAVTTLIPVIIAAIGFYFYTTGTLQAITSQQTETTVIIKEHTTRLEEVRQSVGIQENQQKNLESELKEIRQTQKDIYNLLLEINTGQRAMLRNHTQ